MEWRKREGGGRGARIPEELWQEAVRLARVDGLYVTAQTLRFNYERLKERSGGADGGAKNPAPAVVGGGEKKRGQLVLSGGKRRGEEVAQSAAGDFIALEMMPRRAASQCLVELAGRHGDRMRIEVVGEVDVAALCQRFWSRAS
jgi:hypothetical protein